MTTDPLTLTHSGGLWWPCWKLPVRVKGPKGGTGDTNTAVMGRVLLIFIEHRRLRNKVQGCESTGSRPRSLRAGLPTASS